MTILRVSAILLGPPAVAVAVAFAHHPELLDAAGATLAYFMIPYWVLVIPWSVLEAQLPPPPRPLGPRTRVAMAIAGLVVMYLLFWWGGLGFGAAILVAAAFPRTDWPAHGSRRW